MGKKKLMDTNDLDMLSRLVTPSDTDSSMTLGGQSSKNAMADFFRMSAGATEDIGEFLTAYSLNLSVAESCTGGLLGASITQVSGVSTWFNGGFITYTNNAKEKHLSVDAKTLEKYGAVSGLTVCQMAAGACDKMDSHFALSISGIAGPTGAVEGKPVGTVWIGLRVPHVLADYKKKYAKQQESMKETVEGKDYSWIMSAQLLKNAYLLRETPVLNQGDGACLAREFHFEGDRNSIRQSASLMALYFLYEELIK